MQSLYHPAYPISHGSRLGTFDLVKGKCSIVKDILNLFERLAIYLLEKEEEVAKYGKGEGVRDYVDLLWDVWKAGGSRMVGIYSVVHKHCCECAIRLVS